MKRVPCAALTLALLGSLVGCESGRVGAVRIDPALQALVPAGTSLLAGADIASIRGTELFERALRGPGVEGLDALAAATGIDPRKDVREMLTCSDGKSGVVMAKGAWDTDAIERRIVGAGGTRAEYRGRTIYFSGPSAVWLPKSGLAAAGPLTAVKALIDAQDGDHGIPEPLREELNAAPENSQFWIAYRGRPAALAPNAPPGSSLGNALEMVRGVNGLALGLDLRDGLRLEARVSCDGDEDARRVRDALRGLVGIGRLSTPDAQPDLLKVFDAIEVNRDHAAVSVRANLPRELADKFLDLWLKRR